MPTQDKGSTKTAVASGSSSTASGSRKPNGGTPGKSRQLSQAQPPRAKTNHVKRQRADDELQELQKKIDQYDDTSVVTTFNQLPLSTKTLQGLKHSHFVEPTPIQSLSIPPALRSRDVLGAARTGSGKTLAFLIPLLERLYLMRWGPLDGLGAVVISPTRELALQTFTALRDIGRFHMFSAGLVIGGKPLKEERDRLARMNILIATPGRLLQHLDSTVGFESAGLKVLVLDEADRLLDMGFLPALRAIVQHFQTGDRQTLLFSATQNKDLAALAKLSLRDPLYVNTSKPGEEGIMPVNLEQYYATVPLHKKLDALWGFIKMHLKIKGVVFVTSGKQVRFIFETFRRLHPGLPLLHLHGKQKQATRLSIFEKFSSSNHALLICTDIAARGLDFPAVDWVVQLDCPDDVDTYIHRVGRTARYQSGGKGLCFLCPSEEEGMKKRWEAKGIEVKRIKIKASKMGNLEQQMQNFAFKDPEIKYLGQRAFISYMRSIHIQKDKTVFKLDEYPAEEYAASMGLPGAPQIKLGGKAVAKERGPANGAAKGVEVVYKKLEDEDAMIASESEEEEDDEDDDDEDEDEDEVDEEDEDEEDEEEDENEDEDKEEVEDEEEIEEENDDDDDESSAGPSKPVVRTKYDRMFERKNQSILTPHYTKLIAHDNDKSPGDARGNGLVGVADEDDDDFITLARRDHELSEDEDDEALGLPGPSGSSGATAAAVALGGVLGATSDDLSKRKLKEGSSRRAQLKNRPAPTKLVFDDQGAATDFYKHGTEAEAAGGDEASRAAYVEEEKKRMKEADKIDREVAREKKREKKRKRKDREREAMQEEMGGVAYLGNASDGDEGFEEADDVSEGGYEEPVRGGKKQRVEDSKAGGKKAAKGGEDDEELALRLLRGD